MIDLNDVWSPPPRFDLAAVKAQLAATAAGWLPELFPQARLAPDRRTLRWPTSRPGRRGRRAPVSCISTAPTLAGASTSPPASVQARST